MMIFKDDGTVMVVKMVKLKIKLMNLMMSTAFGYGDSR